MDRSTRRGFTLIELLVVVAIIALLVSILVPSLGKAKELARRAACSANLDILGTAWHTYWTSNDYRFPGITTTDDTAQSNLYILISFHIVNTGYLYQSNIVAASGTFICGTTDLNTVEGPWFSDTLGAYTEFGSPNPWPPASTGYRHTRSCYGTRRMVYYEQNQVQGGNEKPFMLRNRGMDKIHQASGFSFMADNIAAPNLSRLSHVPGVNVLYLDSHVRFFTDGSPNGDILYEGNGIPWKSQNSMHNYKCDLVYQQIDEKG